MNKVQGRYYGSARRQVLVLWGRSLYPLNDFRNGVTPKSAQVPGIGVPIISYYQVFSFYRLKERCFRENRILLCHRVGSFPAQESKWNQEQQRTSKKTH